MPTLNLGRVGFVNKGVWSVATPYKINDVVEYNGGIYAALQANTGNTPTVGGDTFWQEWTSNDNVKLSGDQNISGIKTFISSPIIPNATTAFQPLTFGQFSTKLASDINSATAKTTPVDADKIGIWDSVSGLLNSVSWLNIKATLKTYFDTLYLPTPTSVPRFSAYLSTAQQAVTSGVNTKVQFNTEEYDATSAYDNVTNYRFTPLVAGYYEVKVKIFAGSSSFSAVQALLYKNGALIKAGTRVPVTATNANHGSMVIAEVLMNGTTDYIEGYVNAVGTSPVVLGGNAYDTYFQANYKGV